MAVLHFAYTFDTDVFARQIQDISRAGVQMQLTYLQQQASAIVRTPSATLQEALVAVRYSSRWIENDPEEADLPAKHFLLCLLSHCTAVPSLGREGEPSYHTVLAAILGAAGWTSADIRRLLRGMPLSHYLDFSCLEGISGALTGLDDLGGWLEYKHTVMLKRELLAVKPYFDWDMKYRAMLEQILPGWKTEARNIANQAYLRAQEMLGVIRDSHQALFMVLD
jgi:hypothetical protein